MKGSRKVKEHQGVWERLVEPCSGLPGTETGTATRKNPRRRGFCIILLPGSRQ